MEHYIQSMSDVSLLKAIDRWRSANRWYEEHAERYTHKWEWSIKSLGEALELAFRECMTRNIAFK